LLVDQSAEDGYAAYSALLGEVDDLGRRARWCQVEAAVGFAHLIPSHLPHPSVNATSGNGASGSGPGSGSSGTSPGNGALGTGPAFCRVISGGSTMRSLLTTVAHLMAKSANGRT
jgi:hypothetical protein